MAGFRSHNNKAISSALLLLLCYYVGPSMGVLFSTLPKTLIVTASPKPGDVLYAGENTITVTWSLNQTAVPAGGDAAYKKVKVLLCYAPESQKDRGWRKTNDLLKKDKTCQFTVVQQPYAAAAAAASAEYTYAIERDVPTATYFVRAYALDDSGAQVAYGQTTDAQKDSNLFHIVGVTGRHASLDIAAGCFSAFSIAALVFFFVLEKRKAKK